MEGVTSIPLWAPPEQKKVSEVVTTAFTHLITGLELKREVQRFPNYKSDFKCYWQITEKLIAHSWTYPRVINQSYSKVEVRLELPTAVPLLHCWGRQRSRQVPAPLLNILEPREIARGITDKHLFFFTYQTHIYDSVLKRYQKKIQIASRTWLKLVSSFVISKALI